ncbi:MAG: hypothetical protein R3B70_01645 [Polyangiaceae bacterium]
MTPTRTTDFGDLLRALHHLAPEDEATSAAIATLLGLDRVPSAPQSEPKTPTPSKRSPPIQPVERPADEPRMEESAQPVIQPLPPRAPDSGPLSIRVLHAGGALTAPLPRASALPAPVSSDSEDVELDLEPLFEPGWTRSILAAALAVQRPDGSIEVDKAVSRIARRLPITTLPRRKRPTLRMGVQVLVDRGEGMEPFQRDAASLIARVRAVVGQGATEVLRFDSDPRLAGPGPKRLWAPYRPPAPGAPVLVLSDLGILQPDGMGAERDEMWLDLTATLRRAGCPLIAFVPQPARRFPAVLAQQMTLIEWDRPTTVAAARNASRREQSRP